MSTKREWNFDNEHGAIRSSDGLFPELSVYAKISSEFELEWKCYITNDKGHQSWCMVPRISWADLLAFLEKEYPVVDGKEQKIIKLKRMLEFLSDDVSDLEDLIVSNKDKIKNIENEISELEKT